MKAFLVTYEGLWLGGNAVVFAESAEAALALVEAHPATRLFRPGRDPGMKAVVREPSISELDMSVPNVAYNDTGDY